MSTLKNVRIAAVNRGMMYGATVMVVIDEAIALAKGLLGSGIDWSGLVISGFICVVFLAIASMHKKNELLYIEKLG